jgi:hypothetical protein
MEQQPQQPPLTKLMETLARLFDTVDRSKLIVAKANMNPGKIQYSTASVFNWMHIVHASLRQDALDRLVAVAIAEREEAKRELQDLLNEHKEWWKRNQTSVEELIALTTPSAYFEIFLTRTLKILFALVLFIGIAAVIYRYTPSSTSNFSIRGPKKNDASAFVAKIHNDGGRSAEFVDGGFTIEFTGLPIQTHTNVILVDAKKARRIRGHDDDVHITLTTTTVLKPIAKVNGEKCFPTEEEVKELLPNGKVVLTAKVEESDHRQKTLRTKPVAASLIQPFILRAYPDDVPTLCH